MKKIRVFASIAVVLAFIIFRNPFAIAAEDKIALSDTVTASLSGSTLIIEGYGSIPDYSENGVSNPLYGFRDKIDTIIIDITIEQIGNNAFRDFIKLKNLTIKEGVSYIGENSFMGCYMLSYVSIPGTVKNIGENAFLGCDKIISLRNDTGIDLIGQNIISGCIFENIHDYEKFSIETENSCLSFVAYENSCYLIECSAQNGSITLPEKVQNMTNGNEYNEYNIYNYAFADSDNLTQINIPSSVKKIGDRTFFNCTLLSQVRVSGDAEVGEELFMNTSADIAVVCGRNSPMHVYAEKNNINYSLSDEVLYKGLQYMIDYDSGSYDVRFVAVIKSIDYANAGFSIYAYTFENGAYTECNSAVVQTQKVYKTIYGMNGGVSVPVADTSATEDEYLVVLRINGIPLTDDIAFDVTPFVEKEDSEKIYGDTVGIYISYGGGRIDILYGEPVN